MRKIKIVTFPLLIFFLIVLEIFGGFVLRIKEAEAAHTVDTNSRFTGATSPLTSNYTCGNGATVLVLGIVVAGSTNRAGGAPTYNGVALTQADITRKYTTSPETNCELWYLINPPTGSSFSISVPNTGSLTLYVQASTYKAQAGYTSALDVSNGNTGLSADPSVSVTTSVDGDVIVGVLGDGLNTAPTGQTGTNLNMTDDGNYSDSNQYYLQAALGAWATGWTVASDDWCMCVAAFKEQPLTITVASSVPQPPNVATPSTVNLMGVFSIVRNSGTGSVTAVTIKENGGSIDATNELENVELWLSSDKTWDAGDTKLDTAKNFTGGVDGTCTFNASFDVTTTTKYLIVRLDVKSGVTLDKTIKIQIQDITTTDQKSGLPCDLSGTTTVTASWWNASWSYRKKITFNNSAQAENLTYFPVLVKLTTSNFNYSDAKSDGTDLRFIDSDNTTELKYHIEKWNPSGDSFIWVRVPQIDASSNTDYIYMYYGNAAAGDVQDEPNTFSNNYIAVYHMDEASWNGTTGEVKDSTSNGNDGTRAGNATTTTTGQVNGCGTFDGNGDYVEVPDSASLDVTNLTINAWANSTDFTPSDYLRNYDRMIVSKTDSKVGYQLGLTNENKPYFGFEDLSVNNTSKTNNAIPTQSNTTGTDGRIPRGSQSTTGDFGNTYTGGGSVIKDGTTYKMWYSGYNPSAPAKICVYYATSTDGGLTWTKYDNTKPTAAQDSGQDSTNGRIYYGSAGRGDTTYIYWPSVIKDGSTYKMWYTGYSDEATPKYRIFYATSSDGLNWTKYDNSIPANSDGSSTNGRIPLGSDGKGDDVHAMAPSVIKDGSTYKMWYIGNDGTNGRIFYATSTDGLAWTKYDNSIAGSTQDTGQTSTNGRIYLGSDTTGDDSFAVFPTVIKDGSTYKMWYSGYDGANYRIYYATSPDGLTWTKYDNSTPAASDTTSTDGRIPRGTLTTLGDYAQVCYPSVIKDGSTYKIWYTGKDGSGTSPYYVIYLATLETGVTSNTAVPSEFRMLSGVSDITADTLKLYVNGSLDTSGTTTVNAVNNSEKLTIGNLLNGKIDEVRISTVTRSADWIAAQYLSMTYQFTSFAIPTVTLADGTDPGSSTAAPGSTNNYLDQFTFVINSGTDSVTALTVTSANTSAIASMQIWNDAMTTQYFSTVSSPVGNNWNFSGGTAIPVSTTTASFRVIFTAKDHSLAVGTYAVTGTVTSYTCTNAKSGADTDSATITVDNSPPADATWGTITPGDMQIVLNWTNPGDSDFNKVLILRKADSEVTDSPTEGTEYNVNDSIGGSTVRYVDSGTNSTDTGLTNGTTYYYKIFAYDTYVNYAAGVSTGPHIPIAEGGPITTTGSGYWHSTTPNQPWPAGIVPGPGDTVIIDTGHVVTSTAPVTISSITVNGSLYFDAGAQAVTFTINNGGELINSGTVRVSSATYNVTLQAESDGGITFEGNDIDYNGRKIYLARLDYKPAMNLSSGETVELLGSCTFYAITTQSGSSFIQGSNNDIYISSNTTLASGTFTKDIGSGKVYFIGDLELASANQNLGNVYIGSSPETTTLTEDFSADSLTINSGDVFNTKGYEVTVTTDIVINGTLDCTDSAPNNEGDGTIIILGRDWTKADTSTFTVAGATVTFSNASSTSTLAGSTTFYGLVSTASGKTVKFSSNTITAVTGHLNFENITLRSTLNGATWYLTLSGTQDLSGVDVQDSNAGGGSAINAINSIDSGNNTNWNFATHRYWVGGGSSTDWNATGPTNWSATSGGSNDASVPDSTCDVFFDDNSGTGTANISANITVKSVDCTGFTGTWTQANSTTLTVAGSLKLVAGMTYAPSDDTQAITITGTGNVYTGAKVLGNFTVNGSGITVTLQDSFTNRATTTRIILTQGTLDTNGQTMQCGRILALSSSTKTITLGASQVTCTGATAWDMSGSNTTVNANTSTIILNGASTGFWGGGKTYNIVQLTGSGTATVGNADTFGTLTRTGTSAKTNAIQFNVNPTITGTLNLNGNSSTNRLLITSNTLGTARTITYNGATNPNTTITNADFGDITAAGTFGAWDLSGITGNSGDCGGNTNITFTTADTETWNNANGGNWSGNNWTGAVTSRVPLPQDDVIMGIAYNASKTVTADMPRLGKSIDWTGATNSPTWALTSTANTIYGSLNLTNLGSLSMNKNFTFEGRGSFTLTSAGKSFSNAHVYIWMVGGTLTLQDDFSLTGTTATTLYIQYGTFDANNHNLTCNRMSCDATSIRGITMGSGTWTMTSTSNPWDMYTPNLTFNANTSTIVLSDTGAGNKTFTGGGASYNNLSITGGGSGAVIFQGANTFNNFTINNPKTVTLPASTITTINGTFKAIGNAANPITLNSSSGGIKATLDLDGSAYVTNVSATDINGTGTAVTDYQGSVTNCNNWTVSSTEVWVGQGADTNWGTTDNWASQVPTSSVDAIFNDNCSNSACTIAAAATARAIDFTGYTSTLTHNRDITLSVGDASGGSLTMDSGMTYTLGSSTTSAISFVSTTTGNNVTTGGKTLGDVTFNGVGGEWTLQDNLTVNNLTISAGTLDTKSGENNPINVTGNWKYEGGTFECRQSTVTFDNASSTSTLTGSTTFYGLISTASGKRIEFSSSTVTYVTGHLNLENITLRSTLQGATWYLTLSGTQDVSGVDVQDSNAGGGATINAGASSTDSGNNTNWDFGPPAAITDLTATTGTGQGEIELSWSAPGDDGDTGPISGGQYHIKYSSDSTHTWDDMPYEVQWTTSTSPGNDETKTITGLSTGTTYYFYIKTADEVPNWSELSNKATGYTLPDVWKSVQDGDWSSGATWDQGIAPLSWSRVEIYDTVTYDENSTDVTCSSVTVKNAGILQFEQAVDTNTLIVQGNIIIESGGKFLMEPNTGFASIVKIKCVNDGDYGIVVQDGGMFDVRGSSMTYWRTPLAQQANSGQNQMVTNVATGWKVGDSVTVGPSISTNTVQESKITAISGTTITLQDNFIVNRATGSEVVNITRNCVITSTGTGKSYIQNLTTVEANFNMEWVEASYLGSDNPGKYGITFDGSGTRGKINYSSIHHGYYGIYLNSSSNNTLTNNSCYSNSFYGIMLNSNSNNTLTNNSCYSNYGGIYLNSSSNNTLTLTNNSCYSNTYGIFLSASSNNNTLANNNCYSNTYGIFLSASSNNTLTSNSCWSNSSSGICFYYYSSNNTLAKNYCFSNASYGIFLSSSSNNNTLTNNICYLNSNYGIQLFSSSNNNTLTNNNCYSNTYGIYTLNSTNNSTIDCELGKDGNNTSGDIGYYGGAVSTLILKDCELYSSTKVATAGIDTAGSYLLSYNQDDSTGTVKIWGDYNINSGTQRYNHSYQLYSSTSTTPKTMKGSSSASDVKTSDSNCKTELITITYDGSEWDVVGSASGALGSFTGNQNDWSSSGGEFTLDFTQSSPQTGDKVDFVTVAASNDADIQKDVQFGPCATALNSGKSKLKVDTGGTLELVGTQTYPTLVDRISGTTYYTLISTGTSTFTAQWFKFQNVDKDGVQFHSSCSVSLSSGTFDYAQSSSTRTYITCNSLTSNATFYNLTFDDTGSVTPYNIYVKGNDTNLRWYIASYAGVRGGEDYDYDPNNKIIWADQTPPAAITDLSGQCDSGTGEVTLYWSTPGDDGWDNTLADGSGYRIDYSTYSKQWNKDNYQVWIPTSGVAPQTQVSHTITGLTGDTTWYFQIWTRDEVPNWSGLSNGATIWVNPVLSVSISTDTYDFGQVPLAQSTHTVSIIAVTNEGNVKETYSLKISSVVLSNGNPSLWEVGIDTDTAPANDKFLFYSIFHGTNVALNYFKPNDITTETNQISTSERFTHEDDGSYKQTGENVPSGEERKLWFRLDMPTGVTTAKEEKITITISAEKSP